MSVTVRTQDELDQALADRADVICIDSDPGVWLSVADSGSSHVRASGSAYVKAWRVYAVIDMTAVDLNDPATWCDYHGVQVADGIAYLYKAVNQQWTTDRGVDYSPGSTPEALDWDPDWRDCGHGLHFCASPMQSLAYLGLPADEARFLRVGVRLDELVPLGDKVSARRVVVPCVEVDLFGEVTE